MNSFSFCSILLYNYEESFSPGRAPAESGLHAQISNYLSLSSEYHHFVLKRMLGCAPLHFYVSWDLFEIISQDCLFFSGRDQLYHLNFRSLFQYL